MKTNLDCIIKSHLKEYNFEKMFFKKKKLEKIRKIRIRVFWFFVFLIFIPCFIAFFYIKNLFVLIPMALLLLLIKIVDWFYVNPYGIKQFSNSKKKKFFSFKSWIDENVTLQRVVEMNKRYNSSELSKLKSITQEKIESKKGINFKNFELITVSFITIFFIQLIKLDLIYEYISFKWNCGVELTIEEKFLIFKLTLGVSLIILIIYQYIKYILNQSNRDEIIKLKRFINDINDLIIFNEKEKRNT